MDATRVAVAPSPSSPQSAISPAPTSTESPDRVGDAAGPDDVDDAADGEAAADDDPLPAWPALGAADGAADGAAAAGDPFPVGAPREGLTTFSNPGSRISAATKPNAPRVTSRISDARPGGPGGPGGPGASGDSDG